jgi:hypothetical protein
MKEHPTGPLAAIATRVRGVIESLVTQEPRRDCIQSLERIAKQVEAMPSRAPGEPQGQKWDKVTRLEVIDDTGRVYTKWNALIELSLQDAGRTLKVFVTPNRPSEPVMRIEPAKGKPPANG